MGTVTDRATVSRWLGGYEAAWRAPGTDGLAGLFTGDATYLLWVIGLGEDGRCTWFEEWPYWPGRPYSARDDHP